MCTHISADQEAERGKVGRGCKPISQRFSSYSQAPTAKIPQPPPNSTSSWGPSFQTQEPVGGIWHANCNTNPGGCHFLLHYSSLAIVFHRTLPNRWSEINPSTTRTRDSMERALSWSLLGPLSGHKLLHGEEWGELSSSIILNSSMLQILRLKLDYIWDMYDQERKKNWKKVVQEELSKHNPIIAQVIYHTLIHSG